MNELGCNEAVARRTGAGRPRDPAKDDAILGAARDLFFERGFNGSTIEEIAQRANVSKVTVYKRFCDKETLFATCVRAEMARMASAFDADAPIAGGLEERLNAFGTALMSFLSRPNHVALDRVMAQEFVQMPALAKRLFEAGPAQSRARVAEVLAQASETGVLDCPDPIAAAEDLMALWKGMMDVELKFGVRDRVTEEEIVRRVEHGTATFLRAYDGGKGARK
ncbi:TetR/AcrR family transcriptional regulator [Stakelama saccharophila]|uniref:TetR/AcrR family transcriptional regulator n=1 Tax=Stakelama saccharophila TaxID=3075605 RepID=A0ABZ0BCK6_9SPHN|nr:TetR/AcrR family transcriptional regulator [Stakelama sp. W311]WNO54781.1 TetR/AcrR family transcriptional regulator [Stakelama sp. W311]